MCVSGVPRIISICHYVAIIIHNVSATHKAEPDRRTMAPHSEEVVAKLLCVSESPKRRRLPIKDRHDWSSSANSHFGNKGSFTLHTYTLSTVGWMDRYEFRTAKSVCVSGEVKSTPGRIPTKSILRLMVCLYTVRGWIGPLNGHNYGIVSGISAGWWLFDCYDRNKRRKSGRGRG